MVARSEVDQTRVVSGSALWRKRLWRYGPLVLWMIFIYLASTGLMSASNTSRILRPLLLWLYPDITEEQINLIHSIKRKGAHFTEYAILALLAARAFLTSSKHTLRNKWFVVSFCLVVAYALLDEYHQSFVPSRTGSIYDSFIDMAGGLAALVMLTMWRAHRSRKTKW